MPMVSDSVAGTEPPTSPVETPADRGDVAWVIATGDIFAEPLAEPAYAMPYRITVVMIRRDGIWLRLGGVRLRAVHRVRADRRVDRLGNV
jgi:hypothetical protein